MKVLWSKQLPKGLHIAPARVRTPASGHPSVTKSSSCGDRFNMFGSQDGILKYSSLPNSTLSWHGRIPSPRLVSYFWGACECSPLHFPSHDRSIPFKYQRIPQNPSPVMVLSEGPFVRSGWSRHLTQERNHRSKRLALSDRKNPLGTVSRVAQHLPATVALR